MSTRRNILKGAVATGALATFGAGYAETVQKIARGKWSGAVPRQALTGFAPEPEFRLDAETGDLIPHPDQAVSYTMCIGCTTMCGVRVRVDRAANKVLRIVPLARRS